MDSEPENLTLVLLREIRANQDGMKVQMDVMKTELNVQMDGMKVGMDGLIARMKEFPTRAEVAAAMTLQRERIFEHIDAGFHALKQLLRSETALDHTALDR